NAPTSPSVVWMPAPGSRWAQGSSPQTLVETTLLVGELSQVRERKSSSMYSSRSPEKAWVNSCAWPIPNAADKRCGLLSGWRSDSARPLRPARSREGSRIRKAAVKFRTLPKPPPEKSVGGYGCAETACQARVAVSPSDEMFPVCQLLPAPLTGTRKAVSPPSMRVALARGRYQTTNASSKIE